MDGLYDQVKARLASDRCPAVLQVETGMSPDAVEVFALSEKVSALVHPLAIEADPVSMAMSIVSQREVEVFGVTLALVYPGGFAEFEAARGQIKDALRGWTLEGLATPIEYAGERVLQYSAVKDGGLWLHLLRFRTTTRQTYEHQS